MPAPATVSSNSTNLAFAEEATLKAEPAGPWYGLEPNNYPDFGAAASTTSRAPITATRQLNRGTLTDIDAKGGLNSDLTQHNLTRLLQGFFFADAIEKPATAPLNGNQVAITTVDITAGNHYNAAAGLNVFKVGHLAFAKNFAVATNNGLKKITAVAAGILTTTDPTAVEGAGPGTLEAVGFEFAAGDLVLTAVGATFVLTSAAINPLNTLALTVGEWIYVGGDAAGTAYAVAGRFFGRVKSVNATQIILDLVVGTPAADAGAAKTIRIFFGKVLMNAVAVGSIKRRSYNLERQLGNDGDGIQSEVMIGSIANEVSVDLKESGKVTIDLNFVCMDIQQRTGLVGLKPGARVDAPGETAFNTSHDIIASRISVIDPASANPAALFGYMTESKIGIKNNVTVNKALGVLGGFEANAGDFEASGTVSAYFSSVAAAAAIRNNSDVCLTTIMGKQNSGIIMDLPLLGLGNGANKVEKDKPVMVDLTTTAAKCPAGYTALWNFFEYLPSAAMPA